MALESSRATASTPSRAYSIRQRPYPPHPPRYRTLHSPDSSQTVFHQSAFSHQFQGSKGRLAVKTIRFKSSGEVSRACNWLECNRREGIRWLESNRETGVDERDKPGSCSSTSRSKRVFKLRQKPRVTPLFTTQNLVDPGQGDNTLLD